MSVNRRNGGNINRQVLTGEPWLLRTANSLWQFSCMGQKDCMKLSRALWFLAAAGWCGGLGAAAQTYIPGQSYYGRSNYIEYIAGDMPVVFSAPHGGSLRPAEIRDRTQGEFTRDAYTEELARAVQEVFHREFGHYPHLIICRLHRVKVDCNREIGIGAGDDPGAKQAWAEFQSFIDIAESNVLARASQGLYIDLHGQSHSIKRLELGYGLTAAELAESDAVLNKPQYAARSTIRSLAQKAQLPFSELLRGSNSFGGLMLVKGYPAVPSPAMPEPGAGNPYFDGGYNSLHHGSLHGSAIDGLQIESNLAGVRDTPGNRTEFATALARTVEFFFTNYYHLNLRTETSRASQSKSGASSF